MHYNGSYFVKSSILLNMIIEDTDNKQTDKHVINKICK